MTQEKRYKKTNRKEVQAVGAVIIQGKKVLALRRAEELMKGRIDIPAGKIEEGEDHKTALKREVLGETGYEIKVGDHLASVDIELGGIIYHNHLYQAKIIGGQPVPQPGEVDEILWATPNQLLESAVEHGLPEEKVKPLIAKLAELIEQGF